VSRSVRSRQSRRSATVASRPRRAPPAGERSPAALLSPKGHAPLVATWVRATSSLPCGLDFFLSSLGAFLRDRCPTPADGLPVVLVHLADGEVLDVCHIIGFARRWVALAVHDERGPSGPPRMKTAVVPYEAICRFTMRAEPEGGTRIGFHQMTAPKAFVEGSTAERATLPGGARAVAADEAGAPPPADSEESR
jgi:hypothetical protein